MLTWAEYSAITASLVWYGPTEMVLIISLHPATLRNLITWGYADSRLWRGEDPDGTFTIHIFIGTVQLHRAFFSICLLKINLNCMFEDMLQIEEINCDKFAALSNYYTT